MACVHATLVIAKMLNADEPDLPGFRCETKQVKLATNTKRIELAEMVFTLRNRQHTVSVIKEAAEDRSWRVRPGNCQN